MAQITIDDFYLKKLIRSVEKLTAIVEGGKPKKKEWVTKKTLRVELQTITGHEVTDEMIRYRRNQNPAIVQKQANNRYLYNLEEFKKIA